MLNIFSRRAQESGSRAAILVSIIAGLILLYILFLPPAERSSLLGTTPTSSINNTPSNVAEELLNTHPGRIDFLASTNIEKPIPSVNLYTKTEAKVLKKIDFINLKRSLFSLQDYRTNISLDKEKTSNMKITFTIESGDGVVRLLLNNNLLFEGGASPNVVVDVPPELIRKNNNIVLELQKPQFWQRKISSLSGFKVIADITDDSNKEAAIPFILSSSENLNIDKTTLRFLAYYDCAKKSDIKSLRVAINNHLIYNQIPPCGGDLVKQEFSPNILTAGENTIDFSADFSKLTTAVYELDQMLVDINLKEPTLPIYYFDVGADQFENLTNNSDAFVKMDFVDNSPKQAEVYVNGDVFFLDTRNTTFSRKITSLIKKGTNAIKIVPKAESLDITNLYVVLENR